MVVVVVVTMIKSVMDNNNDDDDDAHCTTIMMMIMVDSHEPFLGDHSFHLAQLLVDLIVAEKHHRIHICNHHISS